MGQMIVSREARAAALLSLVIHSMVILALAIHAPQNKSNTMALSLDRVSVIYAEPVDNKAIGYSMTAHTPLSQGNNEERTVTSGDIPQEKAITAEERQQDFPQRIMKSEDLSGAGEGVNDSEQPALPSQPVVYLPALDKPGRGAGETVASALSLSRTSRESVVGVSMASLPIKERAAGNTEVASVPRYSENFPPPYPSIARRQGYEGVVLLTAEVLADGTVGRLKLKKSSGYEILDISAREAVKGWKFSPAVKMGVPMVTWVEVPVRFSLR